MTASPPASPQQLQMDLNDAKAHASALRAKLPDLTTLRAAVAFWVAEVALDNEKKPGLEAASNELKRAVTLHAEYTAAARKVDELQSQVGQAHHEQRMDKIASANVALDKAIVRYDSMSRELCRVYADLLKAQQRSQQTPGARTDIPGGPHLPHLVPVGWMGHTAEHIRDGSLHWLRDEAREAA